MTTILIAEDNAMVGLLMQADLEDAGYSVLGPFPRSAAALAAAAENDINLALLDIDLASGDSGIDLAREIGRRHGTPCLFVTGQAYEAAQSNGLAMGALAKPFSSATLLDAVADALRKIEGEPARTGAVAWF